MVPHVPLIPTRLPLLGDLSRLGITKGICRRRRPTEGRGSGRDRVTRIKGEGDGRSNFDPLTDIAAS